MPADQIVTDRVRRRRGAARTLAALAALSALLAGCGGGGPKPGLADVTTASSSATRSSIRAADGGALPTPGAGGTTSSGAASSQGEIELAGTLRFSECMRANGVPNFPDPNGQGAIRFSPSEIDPNSPRFEQAQQSCARYDGAATSTPNPAQQAELTAGALKLAECMRAHGVLDFPDPRAAVGGADAVRSGAGSGAGGLDPDSPTFQRAQRACGSKLPTRPDARRAS